MDETRSWKVGQVFAVVAIGCHAVGCSSGFSETAFSEPQVDGATPEASISPVLEGNARDASDDRHEHDAGSMDAAPDATTKPACDVTSPWGTPVLVPNVSTTESEFSARLSDDELTIYITKAIDIDHPGEGRIFIARRNKKEEPFGVPMRLENAVPLGSKTVSHATLSGDGLTIYVSADATTALGSTDIYMATRTSTVTAFGTWANVAGVNTADAEDHPYITHDGNSMYFGRLTGASWNLYAAYKRVDGSFGTPIALNELNTSAHEYHAVAADDRTVYFTREVTGTDHQIYVAHRSSQSAAFGEATLVNELNSSVWEIPTWLSSDGCRMYIASNRPGGVGGHDIYIATRSR